VKISFVEVAGFRGFKDKARFEFPTGFAVLAGRNGVGKSTVMDAVEFALTGTINKYQVREAKGGGVDEHLWWVGEGTPDEHYVNVGFVDDTGNEMAVSRSRERGANMTTEAIAAAFHKEAATANVSAAAMLSTTLIRDEYISALSLDLPGQARFNAVRDATAGLTGEDFSKRLAGIAAAADDIKTEQARRVKEVESELGRALTSLTEARSAAERQSALTEAQATIAQVEPTISLDQPNALDALRKKIVDRKRDVAEINAAVAKFEQLDVERQYVTSGPAQQELAQAQADLNSADLTLQQRQLALEDARRTVTAESDSDQWAAHMVALLDNGHAIGLVDGHCPLCAASRTEAEFHAAIDAARAALDERVTRLRRAMDAVTAAQQAFDEAARKKNEAETAVTKQLNRRADLLLALDDVAKTFQIVGITPMPRESKAARLLALERQEQIARLEQASYILEASGAQERVVMLETRVRQLRLQVDELSDKLTGADRAVDAAKQIQNVAKSVANQLSAEQFETVMPLLKEMYRRLRPHTDWREIDTDFGGTVRASLNFIIGDGHNPQFVFSSGQRRAAGIAFLLAIHLSRPWCALRTLLLDDPVQHIDDYRALNLVEVLSAIRRTGRQIIVAVEDNALADVLCRRLRSDAMDLGRRFDLGTANNGSAIIQKKTDMFPLTKQVLQKAAIA
jgi:chromosome segregation protein